MATLVQLSESGDLEVIDPLEPGELPWRTLYGTPDFIAWLDDVLPGLPNDELHDALTAEEQVYAVTAEYVSGEYFSSDTRFKKLVRTPDLYVWEIKTDAIRIFGWVPKFDTFICCFGDSTDRVKTLNLYQSYIAQTHYVRENLDLDEPKAITGVEYKDVISNAVEK